MKLVLGKILTGVGVVEQGATLGVCSRSSVVLLY
jgi:hypothetical protein